MLSRGGWEAEAREPTMPQTLPAGRRLFNAFEAL